MTGIKNAVNELLDLVEHLIATHSNWNMTLTHEEAVAKVAAARAHVVAEDVAAVSGDVEQGDAPAAVQDGVKTVGDVVNMVKSGE